MYIKLITVWAESVLDVEEDAVEVALGSHRSIANELRVYYIDNCPARFLDVNVVLLTSQRPEVEVEYAPV